MRVAEGTRKTVRVFFAIWPNGIAQKQLAELAKKLRFESLCDGKGTKAENIHLTLAFLGEVDTSEVGALCRVADGIKNSQTRAFDLVVEEIHYWKHNNILCVSMGKAPRELLGLVTALQEGLSAAGFALEPRIYRPHITLMRNASCKTLPKLIEPIAWRVQEWMLVKSEQASGGPAYVPISSWSLGTAD